MNVACRCSHPHAARAVLIVFVLLASASRGFAQITAATLSGTFKDQTGAVLPGVDVVVKNVETGLTRTAVTTPNGYFTMPGLPPGAYEVRASLEGFGPAVERLTPFRSSGSSPTRIRPTTAVRWAA